jgi:hypothetical protein
MHTAICAFDDRTRAEQAVDSLVRAGFARHDIHIEHKDVYGEPPAANDQWDGMEREIAVDRHVLATFGRFFASLFGRDNASGHVDTYSQHVQRGNHVVVVDAHDEVEADRARTLLSGLQAGDLNVVHRPEQRPLRDVVGMRQETVRDERAGMVDRSREAYEAGTRDVPLHDASAIERERAMAANRVTPTTGPELRDPDLGRAPGLRYGDKDKPND